MLDEAVAIGVELAVASSAASGSGNSGSGEVSSSNSKSIDSFRRLIDEHQQKLEAYRKDPDAFDNLVILKGKPGDPGTDHQRPDQAPGNRDPRLPGTARQGDRWVHMTVDIPLADLRRACELLIAHVERNGGTVSLEHDYFWSVPPDAAYDVDAEPAELTIGQVGESWDQVRTMLADESRAVGYGLVWLADVLRAVGHSTTGCHGPEVIVPPSAIRRGSRGSR